MDVYEIIRLDKIIINFFFLLFLKRERERERERERKEAKISY